VESLHRSLRKIIKTRGSFPTDEAATKLLYQVVAMASDWRQLRKERALARLQRSDRATSR
jgi:transposase-like protein